MIILKLFGIWIMAAVIITCFAEIDNMIAESIMSLVFAVGFYLAFGHLL